MRVSISSGDAAVFGHDGQTRIADLGQEVDAELAQRDEPEEDDGNIKHESGDGPFDGRFGDLHWVIPVVFLKVCPILVRF
jgi:hypothetical protein